MGWYTKYVLPKILNSEMLQEGIAAERERFIAPHAHGVVLDVGAGSATNLPYFSDRVTKVIALEPSRELWELGQGRVAQAYMPVEYLQAGAEDIPLPDASVDTVVTALSLCSIPDVKKALQEIRRVLKPGGTYVFMDHGAAPGPWRLRLQKVLQPFSKPFTGGCNLDRNIEELIKEAGFTIMSLSKAYDRPLVYLYRGVAIK